MQYFNSFIVVHFFLIFVDLQVNLRLILVSGKTKEFLFAPEDSAAEIAQFVFENWPEGLYYSFSLYDVKENIVLMPIFIYFLKSGMKKEFYVQKSYV